MNASEINAAIAESLGWVDIEPIAKDGANWGREGGWDGALLRVTDYHDSLDAIVPVVRKSNLLFSDSDLQFLCMAPPHVWCKYYLEKKGILK